MSIYEGDVYQHVLLIAAQSKLSAARGWLLFMIRWPVTKRAYVPVPLVGAYISELQSHVTANSQIISLFNKAVPRLQLQGFEHYFSGG